MLIVHLFVSYAHVNLCHFFSSSWCRGLLWLLLVALPGLFCLPFLLVIVCDFAGPSKKFREHSQCDILFDRIVTFH